MPASIIDFVRQGAVPTRSRPRQKAGPSRVIRAVALRLVQAALALAAPLSCAQAPTKPIEPSEIRIVLLAIGPLMELANYPTLDPALHEAKSLLDERKHAQLQALLSAGDLRDRFAADWRYWALLAQASAGLGEAAKAHRYMLHLIGLPDMESRTVLEAWAEFRRLGGVVPPERADEVLGVVIETHRAGEPNLVAAYADQSTRYLTGTGEFVGRHTRDFPAQTREAADALIALAKQLPEVGAQDQAPGPPAAGDTQIVVLTPAGHRLHRPGSAAAAADPMARLGDVGDQLLAMLKAFRASLAARPEYQPVSGPPPNMILVGLAPGSPVPADPLEPYMPAVLMPEDIADVFAQVRRGPPQGQVGAGQPHQHHLAIVSPGRHIYYLDAPEVPGMTKADLPPLSRKQGPLNITAISFTLFDATRLDRKLIITTVSNRVPFFGVLLAYAGAGHQVVAFEGHRSALEAGVRGSDVLIIDSGMLPFLRADWPELVFRSLNPGGVVLVHKRDVYDLWPVTRWSKPPGWRYANPDGEASYANLLLTTMAAAPKGPIRLADGQPVPALWPMADDPDSLESFASYPFDYRLLDAARTIDIVIEVASRGSLATPDQLQAKVVMPDGTLKDVSYRLTLVRAADGARQLEIDLE